MRLFLFCSQVTDIQTSICQNKAKQNKFNKVIIIPVVLFILTDVRFENKIKINIKIKN